MNPISPVPDNSDIIDKIISQRPGPKAKPIQTEQLSLTDAKADIEGKRYTYRGHYVVDVKTGDKTRRVRWSSNKNRYKENIIKVEKKHIKEKLKEKVKEKVKTQKGFYNIEKIRTDTGHTFYLKYDSSTQRTKIINKLLSKYQFNDFSRDGDISQRVYADLRFGERDDL